MSRRRRGRDWSWHLKGRYGTLQRNSVVRAAKPEESIARRKESYTAKDETGSVAHNVMAVR